MSIDTPPGWQLIEGGPPRLQLGEIELVIAPAHEPPWPVDAEVLEEDTYLVLSAPRTVAADPQQPIRVFTRAANAEPLKPGEVHVMERHPLRLLAVVHDLEQEPSCRLGWIDAALQELMRIVRLRRITALAMPLLGTVHAVRSAGPVAQRIGAALATPDLPLRRVWLQTEPVAVEELCRELERGSARAD